MEIEIIKDYDKYPEEEIEATEQALKDSRHTHVGTVRKNPVFGHYQPFLGLVIYEKQEEASK